MKNEHKIILVKVALSISLILMILFFIFSIGSGIEIFGENNEFYYNLGYKFFLLLYFIIGTITTILMCKIDIKPVKTKSKKYKLKYESYKEFQYKLYDVLYNEGYSSFEEFKTNNYSINYAVKETIFNDYVIAILKQEELKEEIYQEFKENYFEEFGNYLIESRKVNPNKNINVFYVICVDKPSKYFTSYTERNVYQYYKRYNLPVGVSFKTNKIYIASQIEGFTPLKYRKLRKMFMKYIKDIIVKCDNSKVTD